MQAIAKLSGPMTEGILSIILSDQLKFVFLNNFHKNMKAKFAPFSGYNMPINYELGIINEHLHVRNSSGLFDVSHMGQIIIPNSESNIESLNRLIPLNFKNLKNNKSYYSFILNNNSGIVDDIIISKIILDKAEFFFIVYNAGRKDVDENIFNNNLTNYTLLIDNSLLAIQGPKSKDVLKFLNLSNNLYFMNLEIISFHNENLIVTRSGYTGEDGFEISIPNTVVKDFVDLIMKSSDIKLCGLGSRDSLRLEAGLSLYGNELNESITPVQAGLTWALHTARLTDERLNGQKNLLLEISRGVKKIKVGIKTLSKLILRSNMKIVDNNNNEIGIITSGGFSPTLKSSIGIGYIDATIDNKKLYVLVRGSLVQLDVVSLPFVKHTYNREVII